MDNVAQNPRLIDFSQVGDTTIGYLTVTQNSSLPFVIQRVYWTYSVSEEVVRGHHAHKELEQLIFATSGTIEMELKGLYGPPETFVLDSPHIGLYIPRHYWRTIKFSQDAVLMCLASQEYEPSDYIHDYTEFLALGEKVGSNI